MNKKTPLLLSVILANAAYAADDQVSVEQLQQQIQELNSRLEILADAVEEKGQSEATSKVHFGGYGELNYNHLDVDGEDQRNLDFRRWVLFVGYEFSDRIRLHSENQK